MDPLVPNATPPNALSVTPPAILDQATVTLAPGDSVTMTVFGRPELTLTGYVSDSGTIDVPLAGSIPVAGLSPTQAAERVATAYREGEYLIDPQVNIVLAAIRSQQISVVGEVVRPGRFPMDTRTTILDALAQAGGISPLGAERAFILRRSMDGVERFEVDLQDLLSAGSGQVVQIRAGDTIVIPKAPLFYIYGEVSRPGAFPLRSKITVIEAISIAGGLTPRGSSRRIEIKRRLKDGKSQRSDAEIDDEVMAEDVINVKERLF
ncbi:SLBB domain-containing protein [Panacagrimonas perspica]|uniref:SLBB domain-containing protein n=1 Tax=Panacagrimonas perspica TaxID=381431 RepID=UPI0013C2E641|nr:SLBB domain-containing protein [Panacagrimonas perspica]